MIFERLAKSNPHNKSDILAHKLELDASNDFNFSKVIESCSFQSKIVNNNTNNINNSNNNAKANNDKNKSKAKEKRGSSVVDINPSTSAECEIQKTNATNNESEKNEKSSSFKLKTKNLKSSSKKLFQKMTPSGETNSNSGISKESSTSRLRDKLKSAYKYEEIKDSSFSGSSKNDARKSNSNLTDNDSGENDKRADWTIANDSSRIYDSENEEIPLVVKNKTSNHHKKKSSHSNITIIPSSITKTPLISLTHASTIVSSSSSNSNHSNSTIENQKDYAVPNNIINNRGEENEGFSKTFETIF